MRVLIFAIKLLVALLLATTGLLFWAAGGPMPSGTFGAPIMATSDTGAPPATTEETLTIMTWNIAYGYGGGSDGSGYRPYPKSEFDQRLAQMATLIRQYAADVVLLQEVDFDAGRSHHTDQAMLLAELAGLPYVAYAPSWNANYVAFPYWPPSHHFGKVYSGGAVLSRYPVLNNQVTLHPKPEAQPWWYRMFYLNRYSQFVELDIPGGPVWIGNNHLEAFDHENRIEQATTLAQMVLRWPYDAPLLAFGGDFNAVPASAGHKHDFPGYPDDDYRDDGTLALLTALPGYAELVSDMAYARAETDYWTFPAHAPQRRLDYLVIQNKVPVKRFEIIRTGEISDHLPVVAEIQLGAPTPSSSAADPSDAR